MARYTKEDVLQIVEKFYQKEGRAPRMDEMNSKNGLPTIATFKKLTGVTPGQYLREQHPDMGKAKRKAGKSSRRKGVDAIVAEYREFYETTGRMPTTADCREKKLAYPATFKKATGFSPWAYFRQEQINSYKQQSEQPAQASSQESHAFILELMERLGTSLNDVAIRSGVPAQEIKELLNREPSEEFRQLYAIARTLNVPMEILYKSKR